MFLKQKKKGKKSQDDKKSKNILEKEKQIKKIITEYINESDGDNKISYNLSIQPKKILPNGVIHQPYRFDKYKKKINRAFLQKLEEE